MLTPVEVVRSNLTDELMKHQQSLGWLERVRPVAPAAGCNQAILMDDSFFYLPISRQILFYSVRCVSSLHLSKYDL